MSGLQEHEAGLSRWCDAALVRHSLEAASRRSKLVRLLLEQGLLPASGWDESTVEWFVRELSLMDSNNFFNNVGAGSFCPCRRQFCCLLRSLSKQGGGFVLLLQKLTDFKWFGEKNTCARQANGKEGCLVDLCTEGILAWRTE